MKTPHAVSAEIIKFTLENSFVVVKRTLHLHRTQRRPSIPMNTQASSSTSSSSVSSASSVGPSPVWTLCLLLENGVLAGAGIWGRYSLNSPIRPAKYQCLKCKNYCSGREDKPSRFNLLYWNRSWSHENDKPLPSNIIVEIPFHLW